MSKHHHDHEHCSHQHHEHDHDHGHSHHHAPKNFNKAFIFGITLNFAFVIVESVYGYFANSMALLADAGHNLSDVFGLLLAFAAVLAAKRKATAKYTYGLKGSSILAALLNGVILFIAVGGILWESIHRFWSGTEVISNTMIVVALIGIFINTATALLFFRGREDDLNIRGAFLHMVADALVSLAVVIAGLIIHKTNWFWIDPLMSVIICAVIIYGTWKLLREALDLALSAVPVGVDIQAVKEFISKQTNVDGVHDLHIWGMSTSENALTAHIVVSPDKYSGDFASALSVKLKNKFKLHHCTIQIDSGKGNGNCDHCE